MRPVDRAADATRAAGFGNLAPALTNLSGGRVSPLAYLLLARIQGVSRFFPTSVRWWSSAGHFRERCCRSAFFNRAAHRAERVVPAKKRRNTRMRLPIPQRAGSIGLVWPAPTARRMKSTSAKFDIQTFIPYQLVVLASYVGSQLLRAYGRYGISVPEWRVIATIAATGPVIASEIGLRAQLDEVAVHRAMISLTKRGLVRRTTDVADRRGKPLHLTPFGKATYRAIVPLAREFEDWMLAKLPENERKDLVRALGKLCSQLQLITQPMSEHHNVWKTFDRRQGVT